MSGEPAFRSVGLQSSPMTMPERCARCGEPPVTTFAAPHELAPFRASTPPVRLPVCARCGEIAASEHASRRAYLAMTLGGALTLGAAAGFRTPLPTALWLAVAAIGAVAFAEVAGRVLLPGVRAVTATTFVRERDARRELVGSNAPWLDDFAAKNDRKATPTEAFRDSPRWQAFGLGVVLALGASVASFFASHHALRVDDALGEPVALWVDGRVVGVVPADPDGTHQVVGYLPDGTHDLGESEPGATAPRTHVKVDLAWAPALYSPGGETCYWRSSVVYGGGSTPVVPPEGPMPRAATFSLAGIDDVLVESPEQQQSRLGRASVRVRLDRDLACTEALRAGCDDEILDAFAECRKDARDDDGVAACAADAVTECKKRLDRLERVSPESIDSGENARRKRVDHSPAGPAAGGFLGVSTPRKVL